MPSRYGPAELYGQNLAALSPDKIRDLSSAPHKSLGCPFKPLKKDGTQPRCPKKGGVCSIRDYTRNEAGVVAVTESPVTTCPSRFLEEHGVFSWVGKTLPGTPTPLVISELPFLMGENDEDDEDERAVGKIDKVLVYQDGPNFRWCALEMQAVYFSGKKMENDFEILRQWQGPSLPFPPVARRPDFRSSGPKRLMPQLQIKVPTIGRWGKKMAVVVDLPFWESLGEIREVRDVSNCDIAWFVLSFVEKPDGHFALRPHRIHFTTLSHAVEGLTGGSPVSLEDFENEIRAKLPKLKAKRCSSQ